MSKSARLIQRSLQMIDVMEDAPSIMMLMSAEGVMMEMRIGDEGW